MDKSKTHGIMLVVILALIGIPVLDLMTGNSNKPILPASLGNVLNQQIDIVLIVLGVILFFFILH